METEMITLEINGKTVEVPKGTTILNAAKAAHIKIPTLCYHPDLKPGASSSTTSRRSPTDAARSRTSRTCRPFATR